MAAGHIWLLLGHLALVWQLPCEPANCAFSPVSQAATQQQQLLLAQSLVVHEEVLT